MRNRLSNFLLLTLILSFSLSSPALGQRTKKRPRLVRNILVQPADLKADIKLTPDEQRRQDAFMTVWQTVNTNYFDKTFSGLDWNKIREEYQPRVSAAKTDSEVHRILAEMVNRLGRSHFAIIPPEYMRTIRQAKAEARAREKELSGIKTPPVDGSAQSNNVDDPLTDDPNATYGVGIDLKLINDRFVILRVDISSSSAAAGLRPGFVLDKINGVSLTDLVSRILTSFPDVHNIRRHLPLQIVAGILNGEPGSSVFLTCLDETDQPHDYKVPRLPLSGDTVSIGKKLPLQFLQYQAASLDDDVGYIKFNIFAIPVIDKVCASLTDFAHKKALIIDLRGNVGGVLGTIIGLTGMMSNGSTVIGTTQYRSGSEPMTAEPKKKRFNGRLVFLVDQQSVSAAEVFAASMQDNRRAIIVGDHTAGEALPSVAATLATGAVLVYPIANFITPSGRSIEGTGVEPDYLVKLDRTALLNGVDTQLDKALALIRSGVEPPKAAVVGENTAVSPVSPALRVPIPPPPPAKPPERRVDRISSPTVTASKFDPAAQRIVDDFAEKMGSRAEVAKIMAYGATGHGLISFRGVETDIDIQVWRRIPDKFTMIMSSPALGETREIYNGGNFSLQTDFGTDTQVKLGPDLDRVELFSAVFDVLDPELFKYLKFEGAFDLNGRKVNVVTAKNEKGSSFGLAFDQETKMLVRYTPPGLSYGFSDYRKIGSIMLPFQIDIAPLMRIRLDSIDLNPDVDPSNFERKEKCFDKEP